MPNRNGRGPSGQGPLTGRGKGRCNKNSNVNKLEDNNSENVNKTFGVGQGGDPKGGGRGKCHGRGRN